jgi:Flp pilus assembly protein TadD
MAEFREAIRLTPNKAPMHFNLGVALERKGNPQGALEEYRTAYKLDPSDPDYKQNYERLMPQVNR